MFYVYNQNNSGGFYMEPAINVVIEAKSGTEADLTAVKNGVYFDPEYIQDCDCCGTRWDSFGGAYWNGYSSLSDVFVHSSPSTDNEVPDVLLITADGTKTFPYIVDNRIES